MMWNPVNDRIISARIYCRFIKTTFIQVLSPTKDAVGEEKYQLYEEVQKEINATPMHDLLITIRDASAKVSSSNSEWERVMGEQVEMRI